MRGRRLRRGLAGMGLAILTAGMVVLWPETDRITIENCGRIRLGMTLAEVEAVLGPHGDHRTQPTAYSMVELWAFPGVEWEVWEADNGTIAVGFDGHGWVRQKQFLITAAKGGGPFDTILWRAKRLWRRWFPEG